MEMIESIVVIICVIISIVIITNFNEIGEAIKKMIPADLLQKEKIFFLILMIVGIAVYLIIEI